MLGVEDQRRSCMARTQAPQGCDAVQQVQEVPGDGVVVGLGLDALAVMA